MTYYTNRYSTPLAFHSFIKYFSLPLGILKSLGDLATSSQYTVPRAVADLDIVISLIDLCLLVVAFVGFIRWASYGWTAFGSHLVLMVVYALAAVCIYAQYDAAGVALGSLLVTLIYCGLVGLYYIKRRYLFFPDETPPLSTQPQTEEKDGSSSVEAAPAPELTPPPVAYCRHCGQELLPHSLFCSGCGAEIREDTSK